MKTIATVQRQSGARGHALQTLARHCERNCQSRGAFGVRAIHRRFARAILAWLVCVGMPFFATRAEVIYETTSPYHHIRVMDEYGMRTLCFDASWESRMSLQDPLKGHFEYTEYFHMPWLWNPAITNVLMIGLGGGTTQRAYQHTIRT